MPQSEFVIVHISDLHFADGTDARDGELSHDSILLQQLEEMLPSSEEADFLVVSGDVSNGGTRQAFINASAYLFETLPIGGEEYTGLHYPSPKAGIVPGNHDAYNRSRVTSGLPDFRQKSLENYNAIFSSHQIPADSGCYYRWLEKGPAGIYMAFVDSCFLGDRPDQTVAKGKLSVRQSETLLDWHDQGMRGNLPSPETGKPIDRGKFSRSLKILVMHHYLFEPTEWQFDSYFMKVEHRNVVFRNIAFADFDVLMAGHRHVPSFNVHSYGWHFDTRAKSRYALNYFRRAIGLASLPVQLELGGERWSKALTNLANVLFKKVVKEKPGLPPEEVVDEVLKLLRAGLDDPSSLEQNVRRFLHDQGRTGEECLDRTELREIYRHIAGGLTLPQRQKLGVVSRRVAATAKNLGSRPFVQALSGSSASRADDRWQRAFNVYRISYRRGTWTLSSERYCWDGSRFGADPLVQQHQFRKGS